MKNRQTEIKPKATKKTIRRRISHVVCDKTINSVDDEDAIGN